MGRDAQEERGHNDAGQGAVDERRLWSLSGAGTLKPIANALAAPGHHATGGRTMGIGTALSDMLIAEQDAGTAFVLLPVFMGLGALAYFTIAWEPGWVPLAAASLATIMAALGLRERPLAFACVAALMMVSLGLLSGKVETWRAATQMNGSAVTTHVTAQVLRMEHRADGRVRLTLDIVETRRPELRHAPRHIRATARNVPEGLRPGDAIDGVVRIMPPSGPVQPGGYDFAFMNYFDGIGASGFFLGDPERAAIELGNGWRRQAGLAIERLRLQLAERVRARIGGPEGEIAATLIAGVRSGIPDDVAEALRRTGLAHVLAISGLHMGLVAVTIMGTLRLGFALFPRWASRYPIKKIAAALALIACAFYLALSGAAVAAQRAFIMLAVMLLALLFDRAALTMRNLAIAALIVLTLSPHEIVGPSFQMSFAATAVLIGFYAAWSQRRTERQRREPFSHLSVVRRVWRYGWLFVAGLAVTSILAGLATTIYGVYHFHRVSPYALQVNMLAMPIVTGLVMPVGVLAVLAMPFGLEGPLLDLMGLGLRAVTAIAIWFSDRSPIDAVGAIPTGAVGLLTAALVIGALLQTALRWLALPVAAVGMLSLMQRELPDVLISEDARLVAVVTQDDGLAVNRPRPNGFTVNNWTMALGRDAWHGPIAGGAPAPARAPETASFHCGDDLCVARLPRGGGLVVTGVDAAAMEPYCVRAAIIVIDDATATDPCGDSQALVLTKRDLARRGSTAIRHARTEGGEHTIRHAVSEPFRPWHAHRRFSREARGLAR